MRVHAHQHGIPENATPEEVATLGVAAIERAAHVANLAVTGPITQTSDRATVYVDSGGKAGWLPVDGPDGVGPTYGPASHRTVQWEADAKPSPEAVPVEGRREDDGAVMVDVPPLIQVRGGVVRAMHRLHTPVTVTAYQHDGTQLADPFTAKIDSREVEVRVQANTALLRVVSDPTPAP